MTATVFPGMEDRVRPQVQGLIQEVAEAFPSFGGGDRHRSWSNPVASALKNEPLMFAAGVEVEEVVAFIMARATEIILGELTHQVAKTKEAQ